MTGLRALAGLVGVAALAAIGSLFAPLERPAAPSRPHPPLADVQNVTTPAAFGAGARPTDVHDVPAGIIQRAADARALERAPALPQACTSPESAAAPAACPPGRETVEIDWDVVRER